ncbi:hypothetical protein SBD_5972 [Streptomyces bottropensis ATCC 25435]|uniref:Uncharacterized protein n=1 Tax=Streptomyces bottropensis ATCC 25435 TaxID=1054862 RepID=M3E9Q3_9ACTN|nr:hypothetical protein SBD_5972 [Streptomyces bottropensis ATCC 25435]
MHTLARVEAHAHAHAHAHVHVCFAGDAEEGFPMVIAPPTTWRHRTSESCGTLIE